MARKKIIHDPAIIVANVARTVLALPVKAWDDYPTNKEAPAFSRNMDGDEYLFVQKDALRDVITAFGQLQMNKAILAHGLVQEGCRNTPCLQVKAKNSQARILVYAFKVSKLEELGG